MASTHSVYSDKVQCITNEAFEALQVPCYRTIDPADALELAYVEIDNTASELSQVAGLTGEQMIQAANYMGQRLLDLLAEVETVRFANDLSNVLTDVAKPYIVMVSKPDYAGGNNG